MSSFKADRESNKESGSIPVILKKVEEQNEKAIIEKTTLRTGFKISKAS